MNLFEINKEIMDCVDTDTGELLDEEKFNALQLSLEDKLEGLGCWIKNLEAEAVALKAEEEAFKDRRQHIERKIADKKKYLTNFLNGQKFESPKVKISFTRSSPLEIAKGTVIPKEYMRYKDPEVDKVKLKKAVKEGLQLEGVQIVERLNLQIK